jgi:oligopeptide/dipeptide ABC transporter ATP-binding protein
MSVEVNERTRPRPRGNGAPLVKLVGVKKYFPVTRGVIFQKRIGNVHAVDGVDLEVHPGETIGLVGETGCGKSTLARVIMKLYDPTDGQLYFDGQEYTNLSRRAMRPLRREMQMIFQDPYASLNPRKTVGTIIGDPYRIHRVVAKKGVKKEVQQLMELVGLNPEHYNRYPHEFSGGQRQRIGVARALALQPKLIVCDEPVSALDVSIQAQILNLLRGLQSEFNLTYVFISHDLAVIRQISNRIAVMYLGKIVELGDADVLFDDPLHPYTEALLSAVPRAGVDGHRRIMLRGDIPSPVSPPSGCVFHTRCPYIQPTRCRDEVPPLRALATGHEVACHWAEQIRAGEIQAKERPPIVEAPAPAPVPEQPGL